MNTRTVLIIAAVVALSYGLALLLVPTIMNPLHGLGTSPQEVFLSRFLGGTLIALGVINWLAKDQEYATLHPILIGNLVADILGLILSVTGTLAGTMSALGWVGAAIYLVLVPAFAYLQFMGQPVSSRQRA